MHGHTVSFQFENESFEGYLSPAATGSGPGVIVLQEWWGLVDHIKDVCDRFAAEGFTALAPDLYQGKSTTEPDEAGSLMMALNITQTERMLAAASSWLVADPTCSSEKIGVIGFCMGGQLAMFAAGSNPIFGAAINFYGIHPNVSPNYEVMSCPVLGVFAEHDDYASPAAVSKMSSALSAAGVKHDFKTYAGCSHAFFNDSRPAVYSKPDAADAWARTVEFLRSNL